ACGRDEGWGPAPVPRGGGGTGVGRLLRGGPDGRGKTRGATVPEPGPCTEQSGEIGEDAQDRLAGGGGGRAGRAGGLLVGRRRLGRRRGGRGPGRGRGHRGGAARDRGGPHGRA